MTRKSLNRRNHEFRRVKENAPEMVLNVMSNEPTQGKFDLLEMFYRGVLENTVAYADLKDKDTGQIVPSLVGFRHNKDTGLVEQFPLARIIQAEELVKLAGPDGKGGYL